nr:amidohydrolase [uncultured Mediterraneibacter sp.]
MREELINKMKETADYIFRHPEVSMEEHKSSRALAGFLEGEGFAVRWGLAGFATAFVAEWQSGVCGSRNSGEGGETVPVIGFLAEYDALPGLGQECVPRQNPDGGPGHGCGHNLLGTACAGAACDLKEQMEKEEIPGIVRVYGCPAEEVVVGKIRMNAEGVFNDLSAAVTWHPFDRNRVSYDIWQAQDIKNYKFYGTAAHASKHPEMGRSALDAAELMNVGVNYLREHVADDVRIHYTYTNTDGPANIVPPYASTNYFIRSAKWERTQDASERVDNCAKGAALMSGTRVEIERVTCNKEMKVNRTLAEVFYEEMTKIPLPSYTPEEIRFAKEISEEAGFDNSGECFEGLEPLEDEPVLLSIGTDVSDVSHTVPTIMLSAAAMCKGTPLHHWAATAQAGMSIGQKGMLYAAGCMAAGAWRLVKEPELIARAWEEMERRL